MKKRHVKDKLDHKKHENFLSALNKLIKNLNSKTKAEIKENKPKDFGNIKKDK